MKTKFESELTELPRGLGVERISESGSQVSCAPYKWPLDEGVPLWSALNPLNWKGVSNVVIIGVGEWLKFLPHVSSVKTPLCKADLGRSVSSRGPSPKKRKR